MKYFVQGSITLLLVLAPIVVHSAPTKVGKYIIPGAFSRSLEQGMSVPVYIRYHETDEKSQQRIADAIVSLSEGHITVKAIAIAELPGNAVLSSKTRQMVENIRDVKLRDNTFIELSADARLKLNIASFHLELIVSKDALTEAIVARSSLLGPSSVDTLSNVLNYNLGTYYNSYRTGSSSRSYVTLDNTISLREHHLNINGSFYGIGDSNNTSKLYRAMYERDYEGHRLALGMLDTWNVQTIASLNALNGGKIYGVSYGNKGSTVIEKNSLTLTPITVFLPATGEVHVLRDGRLLSVQNFNMGSYEIDTSRFPYGVYDVTVNVVINGRTVNSRVSRVNKIFARQQPAGIQGLYWQLFGGSLDYDRVSYKLHHYSDAGSEQTWIAGGAASITLAILSGLNVKTTLYGFGDNMVNETDLRLNVNEYISLGNQTLAANDSSWRNVSNISLNAPGGYGSLWASREDSHIGDRLPVQERDNYSVGGTINLGKFIPHAGSLTLSQTENRYSGNKYRNLDYSTTLYSGRYATIGLRDGLQRYYHNNRNDDGRQERYVSLDFSLPLASWLSMGVSRDRYGSTQGNLSARKQFSEGAIRSVGVSASTRLNGEQHYDNNYSVNGNINYATKYNAGVVSATRSADNSTNMNFTSQGSVAWSGKNVALSEERQRAGIIVNTGLVGEGKLAAKINGRNYLLGGKSNFIALPPYAQYRMEILNDKNSEDSFDIVSGRTHELTLYPGNVGVINPEVKSMVTVFGRIRYPNGQLATNTEIHNHIGKTRTDAKGEFAIDIDKKYPVITLISANGGRCEADLDLEKARGAAWVGEVKCRAQTSMAQR
ncbi:CS1-pili formation C-terminal domain-containing protein [Citrobacter rodentium]|uniref:Fimbrial usher protein n=2 Tax=Citrobacter rodentium TaxID=67825 RepID=D2TJM3_CITRI|nr:CS1-pili formation C-terminal domain-containing protein [Citrobacter rodentium]KIQ53240.1 membrane protein [Citrobacter rodentium]QBY29376.1 fimbrial biogenesis outer membrane usher protein [Citrobacter rodentium]UHO33222.1 CS1-pili formation C-terminal domain-containing protein [Citrobacter rodentium NBRC 105723 = DSM 16636]CBG89661.1 putative fimbrial usher protein [Citrobacter rodentium ICC168]HAT8015149.1 fimbrial biogenesis outer membrane usher protein [Citrobacter rodentium NBRC 10572